MNQGVAMKKTCCSIILIGSCLIHTAAIAETSATESGFAAFKKKQNQAYSSFKTSYLDRYTKYKQQIRDKWGVAELSSAKRYVHYNEQTNTKVVADFEDNTIEVSILDVTGLSEQATKKILTNALDEALKVSLQTASQSDPLLEQAAQPTMNNLHHNNATILSYLVPDPTINAIKLVDTAIKSSPEKHNKRLINNNIKQLDQQINQLEHFSSSVEPKSAAVATASKMVFSLKSEKKSLTKNSQQALANLTKKNITSFRIELKNFRLKRAEKYLNVVETYANEWQLDPLIVLAIIETESSFNPLAQSYIPAYGLMQIVPSTAGLDVNKLVFGVNAKPSPQKLFNSKDNVKFGSAYVHLLMTRYLKEVEHPTSRLYCAIAAYNTGIGNLSKAFNQGKRGRLAAIKKINQLTPEQVYKVIKTKTHTETQRYLDKVLNSQSYFSQHMSSI